MHGITRGEKNENSHRFIFVCLGFIQEPKALVRCEDIFRSTEIATIGSAQASHFFLRVANLRQQLVANLVAEVDYSNDTQVTHLKSQFLVLLGQLRQQEKSVEGLSPEDLEAAVDTLMKLDSSDLNAQALELARAALQLVHKGMPAQFPAIRTDLDGGRGNKAGAGTEVVNYAETHLSNKFFDEKNIAETLRMAMRLADKEVEFEVNMAKFEEQAVGSGNPDFKSLNRLFADQSEQIRFFVAMMDQGGLKSRPQLSIFREKFEALVANNVDTKKTKMNPVDFAKVRSTRVYQNLVEHMFFLEAFTELYHLGIQHKNMELACRSTLRKFLQDADAVLSFTKIGLPAVSSLYRDALNAATERDPQVRQIVSEWFASFETSILSSGISGAKLRSASFRSVFMSPSINQPIERLREGIGNMRQMVFGTGSKSAPAGITDQRGRHVIGAGPSRASEPAGPPLSYPTSTPGNVGQRTSVPGSTFDATDSSQPFNNLASLPGDSLLPHIQRVITTSRVTLVMNSLQFNNLDVILDALKVSVGEPLDKNVIKLGKFAIHEVAQRILPVHTRVQAPSPQDIATMAEILSYASRITFPPDDKGKLAALLAVNPVYNVVYSLSHYPEQRELSSPARFLLLSGLLSGIPDEFLESDSAYFRFVAKVRERYQNKFLAFFPRTSVFDEEIERRVLPKLR